MSLWRQLKAALKQLPDAEEIPPEETEPAAEARTAVVPARPRPPARTSTLVTPVEYRRLVASRQREERLLDVGSELRLVRTGNKVMIRGYAAVFNSASRVLGWFREVIEPGAFRANLESKPEVFALWNHNAELPLGSTTAGNVQLGEDERGLWYEVTPTDTSFARDLIKLLDDQVITRSSFAFLVQKDGERWSIDKDGMDLRTVTAAELIDVSPVTYPAYTETTAGTRALPPAVLAYDAQKAMELRKLLESLEGGE